MVVDGREEIVDEVRRADADIRRFIAEQFGALLEKQDFDYCLEGNIRGPAGRSMWSMRASWPCVTTAIEKAPDLSRRPVPPVS
ncbi:hypothetical protein [Methylobacterium cerastii]|uniref:hypothetical protein n=1 Tax=Methylobacterium TaxID=407 RepID=UPI0027959A3F|nr:hypothetical protein [Methylobacterium cerastii]